MPETGDPPLGDYLEEWLGRRRSQLRHDPALLPAGHQLLPRPTSESTACRRSTP